MGKGKPRKEMSYFDRTAEWLFPIGARRRKTICPYRWFFIFYIPLRSDRHALDLTHFSDF